MRAVFVLLLLSICWVCTYTDGVHHLFLHDETKINTYTIQRLSITSTCYALKAVLAANEESLYDSVINLDLSPIMEDEEDSESNNNNNDAFYRTRKKGR